MNHEDSVQERKKPTRSAMYHLLYGAAQPLSKPEIAQTLGLSMPTVHQNMVELLDAALVGPAGVLQSRGGRRAIGYQVDERARYALGISITQERIRILAADLYLEPIAYKSIRCPLLTEKTSAIGARITKEINCFLRENKLDQDKLLGVGIALPGVIDLQNKKIVMSPTLDLHNLDFTEMQNAIPYPTYMENDGNCGGYAEWFMQPERTNIAYLSLEEGVGGAILINGAPYVGTNNRSAEFGHICVEAGGRRCQCGNRGCLEAYCSALRLGRDQGVSTDRFFAGLHAGNGAYAALWEDYLDHLAIGIHTIRMMLDCDVVIGGYLAQYMEGSLPLIRKKVAAYNTFDDTGDYVRLGKAPRHAVVRGAALHYIQKFLEEI